MGKDPEDMVFGDAENEPGFGVIPYWERKDGPHYRFKDLNEYCKSKGVEPSDLTPEELEQFRVK